MSEELFKGEPLIINPKMHTVISDLAKAMTTKIGAKMVEDLYGKKTIIPTDKEVSTAFTGISAIIEEERLIEEKAYGVRVVGDWDKDHGDTDPVDMKELIKDL